MNYNVVFENGTTFKNMSHPDFAGFFAQTKTLNWAAYDNNGVLLGPFDSKGNFVGKFHKNNKEEKQCVKH